MMTMQLIGPDFFALVIIAALIVAAALIVRQGVEKALRQLSGAGRDQLERRLDGFTGAIATLEKRVADLSRQTAALTTSLRAPKTATNTAAKIAPGVTHANGSAVQDAAVPNDEILAELLVLIAAAVTSFLCKPVRIRSAKMLQSPYEIVNPWAQQGRVIVQASHALRSWGHANEPRWRARQGVRY